MVKRWLALVSPFSSPSMLFFFFFFLSGFRDLGVTETKGRGNQPPDVPVVNVPCRGLVIFPTKTRLAPGPELNWWFVTGHPNSPVATTGEPGGTALWDIFFFLLLLLVGGPSFLEKPKQLCPDQPRDQGYQGYRVGGISRSYGIPRTIVRTLLIFGFPRCHGWGTHLKLCSRLINMAQAKLNNVGETSLMVLGDTHKVWHTYYVPTYSALIHHCWASKPLPAVWMLCADQGFVMAFLPSEDALVWTSTQNTPVWQSRSLHISIPARQFLTTIRQN